MSSAKCCAFRFRLKELIGNSKHIERDVWNGLIQVMIDLGNIKYLHFP